MSTATGNVVRTLATNRYHDDEHPLARLVAASARSREETRGAHARSDFPGTDSTLDGHHTVVDAATATTRTEFWT